MKLLTVFFFCFVIQIHASVYSQSTLFNLKVDQKPIREVLSMLEKSSKFKFFFNEDFINVDEPVTVNASNIQIDGILQRILDKTNIEYQVLDNNMVVLTKKQPNQQKITGKITDSATGEALPGVSIIVEGTSNGVISDVDGKYAIEVTQPNAVLVFSYMGFLTERIALRDQSILDVKLVSDVKQLNEVVVVGYGTMRKKDVTGSVIQIRPDKLENEDPKTVQDVLRGVPGLAVGYDASAKGGGSLQIRGQRSVYKDGNHNSPMIVLDGMAFYGELSEINPEDIGQIDILKDASAAAIYGAQAANGVIIITTKKGKLGKPKINFSSSLGFNTKSAYRDSYGPDGYMQYREDWYKTFTYGVNPTTGNYEAYQATSLASKPGYYDKPTDENLAKYGITLAQWESYTNNVAGESDASIYAKRLQLEDAVLQNYLDGKTFDWYNHTFRTGIDKNYNLSVSGASDRINYYMSVGLLNSQGAVNGNDYRTIRSNFKVSGKITKWLEVGGNINFQDRSDGDIQVGLGTNYWDANQLRNSPYSNYQNADGSLAQYPMGSIVKRGYNFDFERQYMDLEKGYTLFNTIFDAKMTLPFGITYTFNAAPRFQFFHNRYFTSAEEPGADATTRGVDRGQNENFDWSINNTLAWDHTFANVHHFTLTLVQEAEEHWYWNDGITARNIQPSDALGFHNTASATLTNSNFTSTDTHQTGDALLGRLFYSYNDRYLITASLRRDGYSAFGTNNPYAIFPSVALGWIFTNEKFFKWAPMSLGKLRVSWGKNGNRGLGDPYQALSNLTSANATQGYITASGATVDNKYLYVGRLANPNLQWEKTQAVNVALDFGFLKDRITGSIEFYNMPTKDMIMSRSIPDFTGFTSIVTNLGEVNNKGFEFSLSSTNIKKDKFEWNTSFGFSYNKNEIVHLDGRRVDVVDASGNIVGSKEMDNVSNGWFIGKPISSIWDFDVTGIWQASEVNEAKKYGQVPGDPKVANNYTADDKVNADGSVTPVYNNNDKVFLGQTTPPINWSMRNEFTLWKDLSVSFSMYSYMGHKSLEGNYLNGDNGGSLVTYNYNVFSKEYWTPGNPTNAYARLNASGPSGATGAQMLHDRSFIRLDNISVAYSLPKRLISKINLDRFKIYGNIRNVAVWKKDWVYGDPETGGLATRLFTIGLDVTF